MGKTTNSESSDNKLTINYGIVHVDRPIDNGNGPMDYDVKFEITGGEIITAGSSGMMQNAISSIQRVMLIYFNSTQSDRTTIEMGDVSYTPSKAFSCILVSSSKLEVGKTYDVKVNGSTYTSITLSNTINTSGNGNGVNSMGRNYGRGRW